jgi:flagellar basal-body rod protein FlgG
MNSFFVSAVGLQAQKEQLDVIATNIANTNTPGYKRKTVDFAGLLDRTLSPEAASAAGRATAGTSPTRVDMASGEARPTGRALDIAIVGNGLIEVQLADGGIAYSRGGSLQVDANGMLALASGQVLKADIRVPGEATAVEVLPNGTVQAMLADDAQPTQLGQIELVSINNPEALRPLGGGLYEAGDTSTDVSRAVPGESWAQPLAVRSLEASNVRMVDEMVNLLLAQRVYELNAKMAQAADEMMGLTNSLRK